MNIVPFILSLSTRQVSVVNKEIESIESVDDIVVEYGTAFNDIGLPSSLTVVYEANNGTQALSINWIGAYDENDPDTYVLTGVPVLPDGIFNTAGINATVNVIVQYAFIAISEDYVQFSGAQLNLGFSISPQYTHSYYRDKIFWAEGKTYYAYSTPYEVKPFQQARLLVYNETRGFDRPVTVGQTNSTSDSHNVPTVTAYNNRIYVMQENPHVSPLLFYKSTTAANYDYSSFTALTNIGQDLAYVHLIRRASNNHTLWMRGNLTNPGNGAGIEASIYVCHSSSGMETWGTQRRVTVAPTGGQPEYRHYPGLPWGRHTVGGVHTVLIAPRRDTNVNHYKHYALQTTDFVTYTNIEGTWSHNLDSDGTISDAVLTTNCMYLQMDNDLLMAFYPVACLSPEGKFYSIVPKTDGTNNVIYLKYYESGAWVSKLIVAPTALKNVGTTSTANYLMVFSDNDIRFMDYVLHGSFYKPHWFRSTDQGDSWVDLGDLNPEITDRQLNPLLPCNIMDIPFDRNFPIYFSYQEGATNLAGLICRQAAWGTIQAVPGVTITPAATMNYNSQGLFHYKAVDADMTRTGNNVLTLVDKFGIRNATAGTNKPQWNGSDSIAFTLASLHYFTVGTPASIANKNALTLLVVAKINGLEGVTLNISLNSTTNKYLEFSANPTSVLVRRANTATSLQYGNDSVDTVYAVYAYMLDGRCSDNLYVNGRLQYFNTILTNASLTTTWDDIGVGPTQLAANIVHIGRRDISTTDVYFTWEMKEQVLFDGVLPIGELEARIKKLCNDYGLTYVDQFQVP